MPNYVAGGPSHWGDLTRGGGTVSLNATQLKDAGPDYWGDLTASTTTLGISGTPVLTGNAGVAYAGFTVSGSGGSAPYTYSVGSGTLPSAITINATTGAVAGTPASAGTSSNIVLRVTDSLGRTANLAAFTLVISA